VLILLFFLYQSQWENEFNKWTEGVKGKIHVYNPSDGQDKIVRIKIMKKWSTNGGVLLMSEGLLRSSMKTQEMEDILSPADAIILDERLVYTEAACRIGSIVAISSDNNSSFHKATPC
jgi:hypothetical protein